MSSARSSDALFENSMDSGNCLSYEDLVNQHTDAVNQLGSWLLYSEGEEWE